MSKMTAARLGVRGRRGDFRQEAFKGKGNIMGKMSNRAVRERGRTSIHACTNIYTGTLYMSPSRSQKKIVPSFSLPFAPH